MWSFKMTLKPQPWPKHSSLLASTFLRKGKLREGDSNTLCISGKHAVISLMCFMRQAVSNDQCLWVCVFIASAQPPRSPDSVVVVVVGGGGGDEGSALQCWSQWETVSQPSRQLDWKKDRREEKSSGRPGRRWEPVARQTDGQINRQAGRQAGDQTAEWKHSGGPSLCRKMTV